MRQWGTTEPDTPSNLFVAAHEEATRNVRQAIELHLENLKAHHEDVPRQPAAAQVFTTLVYV